MSGLAKQKLMELVIDIISVMLQSNEFSLSKHEMQLIRIPEIKHLQFINEIRPACHQQYQEQSLSSIQMQIQHKIIEMNKTANIKMYCQLIIAAISDNDRPATQKLIEELMRLIDNSADLQKTIFFLFGVTSLLAIQYYPLQHNKEYKYDLKTQALLTYILSNLQPQNAIALRQKFNRLYEEIVQNRFSSKLLESIHKIVNQGEGEALVHDLIVNLMQIESKFAKSIYKASKYTQNTMTLVNKIIDQGKIGNRKLIEVLNLLNETQHYPFFKLIAQDLCQTKLIKKILQHKTELQTPLQLAEKHFKVYLQKREFYGLGDVVKYKRCQTGMSLLKYNFRNSEVGWRYVKIGEDGIYWGKQAENCPLKCQWVKVEALVYGKVSVNIVSKCKYISSDNIFSLILKNRSIDFICQNEEEMVTWLQGIAYVLNKHWSMTKKIKIVFTQGSILWKKLFMRLSCQADILLNKSSGIIKKDTFVRYKLKKQRGEQSKW